MLSLQLFALGACGIAWWQADPNKREESINIKADNEQQAIDLLRYQLIRQINQKEVSLAEAHFNNERSRHLLTINDRHQIIGQRDRLTARLRRADEDLNRLNQEHNTLRGQHNTLDQQHADLNGRHDDLNGRHNTLNQQHANLNGRHDDLNRRHNTLEQQHEDLNGRHDDLNGRHNTLNQQYGDLNGRHDALQDEHNTLNNQHSTLSQQHNTLDHQHSITVSDLQTANSNIAGLQHVIADNALQMEASMASFRIANQAIYNVVKREQKSTSDEVNDLRAEMEERFNAMILAMSSNPTEIPVPNLLRNNQPTLPPNPNEIHQPTLQEDFIHVHDPDEFEPAINQQLPDAANYRPDPQNAAANYHMARAQ